MCHTIKTLATVRLSWPIPIEPKLAMATSVVKTPFFVLFNCPMCLVSSLVILIVLFKIMRNLVSGVQSLTVTGYMSIPI